MSFYVYRTSALPFTAMLIAIVCLVGKSVLAEEVGYGYKVRSASVDPSGKSITAELQVILPSNVYGPDIPILAFNAILETNTRLRVRITDASKPRWEVPDYIVDRAQAQTQAQPDPSTFIPVNVDDDDQTTVLSTPDSDIIFTLHHTTPFGFTVKRNSSSETLFDTRAHPPQPMGLVFKDQYIQLSTSLPADRASLYGLGEHMKPVFKLAPNQMLTLWSNDMGSNALDVNLYGSHPVYMDVRKGRAHMVLLMNSNGMDVEYGGDRLTYKVIGGVVDLYLFAGPTPEEAVDQYTMLIGRPAPMPYWAFGFHQCRYGYKNLKQVEEVVDRYAMSGLPLEGMWTDLDYMDFYKDFTFDPINFPVPDVKNFVTKLHNNGQKYIVIIDPGLSINSSYETYNRGIKADAFIKYQGHLYEGKVWPGPVHFPDFLNPATVDFWTDEVKRFRDLVPVDGLWTDMNEPTNFGSSPSDSPLDNPPYVINNAGVKRPVVNHTVPMSAYHYNGVTEYDVHNAFGHMESKATNIALTRATNERPFVLARATFVGSGKFAAKWTGDNTATWENMGYTIPTILSFGLFGIPMIGADICGFHGNTTEELCQRWTQLGAFYPFARDHYDTGVVPHELYQWPTVLETAKKVFALRYRLLPYYYTLMYEAHTRGTPIARPLFFSFPDDTDTYELNGQFLIGKGVLISPVLKQGQLSLDAYFPKGNWFNLFDYSSVSVSSGQRLILDAPLDKINVHVGEGNILPLQGEGKTTQEARKTPFELLVVVRNNYGNLSSVGSLFLDNGVDIEMGGQMTGKWSLIHFEAFLELGNKLAIVSNVEDGRYALSEGWILDKITVLGLKNVKQIKGYTKQVGMGMKRAVSPRGSSIVSDANGDFQIIEISKLNLLIGKDFKLEVEMKS